MILVDTSVWVDHLRRSNKVLEDLLAKERVLSHPFVVGEIALGGVRSDIIDDLRDLPEAMVATDQEVLSFIQNRQLAGTGIGYVDAHLIAAARLMGDTKVWTRDKKLESVADAMGLSANPVQ